MTLFDLMHIKLLLKRGLLLKGKNLLPSGANSFDGSKFFPFKSRFLFRREAKPF